MDFRSLLIGFDGRINRARWWLGVLCLALAAIILTLILGALFGVGLLATALVNLVVTAAIAWPATALMVKRLKDRDRPLWLVAVFWVPPIITILGQLTGLAYVPMEIEGEPMMVPNTLGWIIAAISLVIGIWSLVELGVLRGTDGPNRHGPDPLAEQD